MKLILLILIIFISSTLLFKKAVGTLNPGKLNIISYVYYIFMVQSFAGAALILLGNDKHYTLNYLLNREESIRITISVIFLTAVLLPGMIIIFQKIFRQNIGKMYVSFLKQETEVETPTVWWKLFYAGSAICILVLIGFLIKVGYIPVLRLIHAPEGFNFGTERNRIASTYFIHPYISNILLFTMIPLLAYISFASAFVTKQKKWIAISGVLFVASCICKTYKFEKSPIIFHLLVYVLIVLYLSGGIKFIYMMLTGGVMGGVLIASYFATGFTGTLLDIYNGPLGRTLFTEVGTLSYCFDLFPNVFGYLNGRSFTPTILKLLGMSGAEHLRSAKLTMAFYGSEKVYDGTAGVMNTLFVGEAYANWGYPGVILSIVWVALVISVMMILVLKMRKTPSVVALLALLTVQVGSMLEGGFCDFVYSFNLIFTIFIILGIYMIFENRNSVVIRKVKGKMKSCIKK